MDIRTILLGEEEWAFLLQVPFRVFVMFAVTLITLRVIGKRGIMQGVFELLVIVTLGSAAGDPMFYQKVGLLPAILVFVMVIILYKMLNKVIASNKSLEHLIEGKHMKLVSDGEFEIQNVEQMELNKDEFFSDLRLKGVSQLGQVRAAYVEASGKISVFFQDDKNVKTGLPIFPEALLAAIERPEKPDVYACTKCGHVAQLGRGAAACTKCGNSSWVLASPELRVI
jgi:uncharacterized membrane protein YcaP (DUF421 family)